MRFVRSRWRNTSARPARSGVEPQRRAALRAVGLLRHRFLRDGPAWWGPGLSGAKVYPWLSPVNPTFGPNWGISLPPEGPRGGPGIRCGRGPHQQASDEGRELTAWSSVGCFVSCGRPPVTGPSSQPPPSPGHRPHGRRSMPTSEEDSCRHSPSSSTSWSSSCSGLLTARRREARGRPSRPRGRGRDAGADAPSYHVTAPPTWSRGCSPALGGSDQRATSTTSGSPCGIWTPRSSTTGERSVVTPTHRERVEDQGVEEVLFPVGDSFIQLLGALGPDTPVGAFLAKRGPGVHHVAYRVRTWRRRLPSSAMRASG